MTNGAAVLTAQADALARIAGEVDALDDTVPPPVVIPPPVTPPSGTNVLLAVDFENGLGGIQPWNTAPAGAPPSIVPDPLGGNRLQMTWTGNAANNRGALIRLATAQPKVHIRFRYALPADANVWGIMKLIRFRGPGDKAIGTLNVQSNQWLHWGDDLTDGANHVATGSTPGAAAVGKRCWVEFAMDYTTGTSGHAQVWIDGTKVLDYTRTGIAYTSGIAALYLWGYFNEPAQSRSEWIDNVVVATNYIGVPV